MLRVFNNSRILLSKNYYCDLKSGFLVLQILLLRFHLLHIFFFDLGLRRLFRVFWKGWSKRPVRV